MIKMGASENRGFTPNKNGTSMKEIMVNHCHADLVKQQNEECFAAKKMRNSGEKNGTWLQGPLFLLDVYMLFPNSQTRTSQQKTSPAADAS